MCQTSRMRVSDGERNMLWRLRQLGRGTHVIIADVHRDGYVENIVVVASGEREKVGDEQT